MLLLKSRSGALGVPTLFLKKLENWPAFDDTQLKTTMESTFINAPFIFYIKEGFTLCAKSTPNETVGSSLTQLLFISPHVIKRFPHIRIFFIQTECLARGFNLYWFSTKLSHLSLAIFEPLPHTNVTFYPLGHGSGKKLLMSPQNTVQAIFTTAVPGACMSYCCLCTRCCCGGVWCCRSLHNGLSYGFCLLFELSHLFNIILEKN